MQTYCMQFLGLHSARGGSAAWGGVEMGGQGLPGGPITEMIAFAGKLYPHLPLLPHGLSSLQAASKASCTQAAMAPLGSPSAPRSVVSSSGRGPGQYRGASAHGTLGADRLESQGSGCKRTHNTREVLCVGGGRALSARVGALSPWPAALA